MLAAALTVMPEPTAVVDSSLSVLFANAAWRAKGAGTALAEAAAPPAPTRAPALDSSLPAVPAPPQEPAELLPASLRRGWGMSESGLAACQTACAELGRSAAAAEARTVSWQLADASAAYALELRPLGGGCVLAVIRDVTEAVQLQRTLDAVRKEHAEALERLNCFSAITSETLVVSDRGRVLFANDTTKHMFRYTLAEVIGKNLLDFAAPECHADIIAHLSKNNSDVPYEADCIRSDGTRFRVEVRGKLISYHGRPVRGAALLDITERRRVEELLKQKLREEERTRTQSETLFALSTPLLPVSDEVLVLPLIGSLDDRRMTRITEILLSGLTERRSHFVIIDITGLPTLDSATALGLVRAAQGARLLGAQTILCGIRAEVAHELVRLGADLSGVLTRSTLKSAMAFALSRPRTPLPARAAR